jgi:hypothetical protein
MSTPCCAFIKSNGAPCAARPLLNSPFCLFHDPAHQQPLAASRSKGGAAPRRRLRRFPRLLDHVHVAELLGELFIDALNNPDAIDPHRLRALTALSRVLLKAVGTPPTFLIHSDRREPSPAAGHLLRVYPPLAPEVEALLAAEPPANDDLPPPPPAGSPLQELDTVDAGDGAAWNGAAVFLSGSEPLVSAPALHVPYRTSSVTPCPESQVATGAASVGGTLAGLPKGEHGAELVLNRLRTGPSRANKSEGPLLASLPSTPPARQPAAAVREAAPDQPAPDPEPSPPAAPTDCTASPEPLNPEQDTNRSRTGLPGTNCSRPGDPETGLQTPAANSPHRKTFAQNNAAHPSAPASGLPCLPRNAYNGLTPSRPSAARLAPSSTAVFSRTFLAGVQRLIKEI